MIEIDWNPDRRKLRQFAAAAVVGFPLLGLLAVRMLPAALPSPPLVLAVASALGVIVGLAGLLHPPAVRPVYAALLALSLPFGMIVGVVVLAVIYFGIFTPFAVALRLAGTDPMQRRWRAGGSYWSRRRPAPPAATYFRQY